MAITGSQLIALEDIALTIYDISTPSDPQRVGSIPIKGAWRATLSGVYIQFSVAHNMVILSVLGGTVAVNISGSPTQLWTFMSGGTIIIQA
jgi:hypothetical protein